MVREKNNKDKKRKDEKESKSCEGGKEKKDEE